MSNTEKGNQVKEVHVYLGLQRVKDNGSHICFRHICYDEKIDLELIRNRCKLYPGIWRIHRTVNKRNLEKARKMFIHTLLDTDRNDVDRLWRSCILQNENKAEKKLLLDLDDKQKYNEIKNILTINNIDIVEEKETVNGYHIVINKCDTRLFKDIKDLTILKDGYIFIEKFEVL